jgi:hypothetical protein
VKDAIAQTEIMMKHMIGQRGLNEKFELCDPIEKSINNPLDISNLFEALADNFAGEFLWYHEFTVLDNII